MILRKKPFISVFVAFIATVGLVASVMAFSNVRIDKSASSKDCSSCSVVEEKADTCCPVTDTSTPCEESGCDGSDCQCCKTSNQSVTSILTTSRDFVAHTNNVFLSMFSSDRLNDHSERPPLPPPRFG